MNQEMMTKCEFVPAKMGIGTSAPYWIEIFDRKNKIIKVKAILDRKGTAIFAQDSNGMYIIYNIHIIYISFIIYIERK